ncbi:hypothetical protein [Streptomyces sp. H39-S7]|uniref:hypothetical protein n=1 Tax=Streptomyces sp. H39-S7 TaxID=3004357 RepID=UPI0022AEC1D4|nr:hypothetical protein [Streptomyces sp. H39-S7]MCZ4117935.1 hypothetical protein [Streptomyces sp. H39-S7]
MRTDRSRVPETDICDLCARRLTDGCRLGVVADSSAIHAGSPARDGRRLVVACSLEHLAALQQEYRARPYVPEELWAGQIDRALALDPPPPTREALAAATDLTHLQIQRALAWKKHRTWQLREQNPQTPEAG